MTREFTGKTMAAILIAGFAVVMAVNFFMASLAIGGFGGVVVDNSYVASQKFNGWLAQGRAMQELGYQATLTRDADGRLRVDTSEIPEGALVSARIRRPLGKPEHAQIAFTQIARDRFVSLQPVGQGRWIVRLTIAAEGGRWVSESELP